MSAADDVTVVWLTDGAAREDAKLALEAWARVRGVSLVAPTEASADPVADLAIVPVVEAELDRAREAVAGLDADAAERALARAEALLRAHPELPQAAWLRAEVARSWASRWSRIEPRDEARARAAWQEAYALDGGRAAGVGEIAYPQPGTVKVSLVVRRAASRRAVVRVDGVALATTVSGDARVATHELAPGEHQVVVQVGEAPVLASWVAVAAAAPSAPPAVIRLTLPDGESCGAASFASVVRDGDAVRAPGVACARWVAAAPAGRPGSVLVARCVHDACGPLLEWRTERLPASLPQPGVARVPWPGWATWTMVGFGAAAATTIAVVASGALESRPVESRFVAGGVRVE